jgi:hypothetical protein
MKNKYKSFAQWPKGTLNYSNDISTDEHGSEAAAEAVCQLLHEKGFGGDNLIFPIKTWTLPIE